MKIDYSLLSEAESIVADIDDLSILNVNQFIDSSFGCSRQHKTQLKQYIPYAVARIMTDELMHKAHLLAISHTKCEDLWWVSYCELNKSFRKEYKRIFKEVGNNNAPNLYNFINDDLRRRLKNWSKDYSQSININYYYALNLCIKNWRQLTEQENKNGQFEALDSKDYYANKLKSVESIEKYIDDNFDDNNKILKKQFAQNERVM